MGFILLLNVDALGRRGVGANVLGRVFLKLAGESITHVIQTTISFPNNYSKAS